MLERLRSLLGRPVDPRRGEAQLLVELVGAALAGVGMNVLSLPATLKITWSK